MIIERTFSILPKNHLQDALRAAADTIKPTHEANLCVVVECRDGTRMLVLDNRNMIGDGEGDRVNNYDDNLEAAHDRDDAFDIMSITLVGIGSAVQYIVECLRDVPAPRWKRK